MPLLHALPFIAYLLSGLLLTRYFVLGSVTNQHRTIVNLMLLIACSSHGYILFELWQYDGVFFGLTASISFVAWVVSTLLFLTSFSKPIQSLGILIYPLSAIAVIIAFLFPGTQGKLLSISIAAHVFLSIGAYAILAIAVGQSVLLSIQERYLHERNFNTFVDRLPALQTMESFLYQSLKMGLLLLTLSLISGYLYIDEFFSQNITYKTILSIIAWFGFAIIIIGHNIFGWRGKLVAVSTQIAFSVLVLSYFGTKFI
tara:strand:+ start:453 stop:1223 length:771 start_codon:yes stop_codon:yes gene_type:complete